MNLDGKIYRKGKKEFDDHITSIGIKIHPQGVTPVLVEAAQFTEEDAIQHAKEFLEDNRDALNMWKIDSITNN